MGTSYVKGFYTGLGWEWSMYRGTLFKKYTSDFSGSTGRSLTLPPSMVGRCLSKEETNSGPQGDISFWPIPTADHG